MLSNWRSMARSIAVVATVRKRRDVDEDCERSAFWATRTPDQRLAEVEELRNLSLLSLDSNIGIARFMTIRRRGEPAVSHASAKFHVVQTFTVAARQLFVIAGHIVQGSVSSGMLARGNKDQSNAVFARIDSVESLLPSSTQDSLVALCMRYSNHHQREVLQHLWSQNEVVEVSL
jgi:hypothetical protein